MGEKKQVNLRVDATLKEKWEEAVESSAEYASTTDLIRTSVQKELDEGTSDDSHSNQEVLNALNDLEGEVNEIRTKVTDIQNEQPSYSEWDMARRDLGDTISSGHEVILDHLGDNTGYDGEPRSRRR